MTPLVRGDRLIYRHDDHEQVLVVETPTWFAWLATASTFAFTSTTGTFTARKERASNQRGGWYWKAYRTQHGKLSSLYLGKAEALTLERLNAVAQALTHPSNKDAGEATDNETPSPPREAVQWRVITTIRGDPLLATKFRVPQPPVQLVRRPHLVEQLQQGVERSLTLIAAPAGFGKTTLRSSVSAHPAARRRQHRVCRRLGRPPARGPANYCRTARWTADPPSGCAPRRRPRRAAGAVDIAHDEQVCDGDLCALTFARPRPLGGWR
jgi:hypothetical protein